MNCLQCFWCSMKYHNIVVPVFLFQVDKLVLIDASVYTEGTGNLMKLPRAVAYAGVSVQSPIVLEIYVLVTFSINAKPQGFLLQVYILKSIPLRFYANVLAFKSISFTRSSDWTKVSVPHHSQNQQKLISYWSLWIVWYPQNFWILQGKVVSNAIIFPVFLYRWAAYIVYIPGGRMQLWILWLVGVIMLVLRYNRYAGNAFVI